MSDRYKNGQLISEQKGDTLSYFYKSGKLKATGKYIDGKFEGKWKFFNEQGLLIQEGDFLNNLKDGQWKRYDEQGLLVFDEKFKEGKKLKK